MLKRTQTAPKPRLQNPDKAVFELKFELMLANSRLKNWDAAVARLEKSRLLGDNKAARRVRAWHDALDKKSTDAYLAALGLFGAESQGENLLPEMVHIVNDWIANVRNDLHAIADKESLLALVESAIKKSGFGSCRYCGSIVLKTMLKSGFCSAKCRKGFWNRRGYEARNSRLAKQAGSASLRLRSAAFAHQKDQ
jgi:hypothetical protein